MRHPTGHPPDRLHLLSFDEHFPELIGVRLGGHSLRLGLRPALVEPRDGETGEEDQGAQGDGGEGDHQRDREAAADRARPLRFQPPAPRGIGHEQHGGEQETHDGSARAGTDDDSGETRFSVVEQEGAAGRGERQCGRERQGGERGRLVQRRHVVAVAEQRDERDGQHHAGQHIALHLAVAPIGEPAEAQDQNPERRGARHPTVLRARVLHQQPVDGEMEIEDHLEELEAAQQRGQAGQGVADARHPGLDEDRGGADEDAERGVDLHRRQAAPEGREGRDARRPTDQRGAGQDDGHQRPAPRRPLQHGAGGRTQPSPRCVERRHLVRPDCAHPHRPSPFPPSTHYATKGGDPPRVPISRWIRAERARRTGGECGLDRSARQGCESAARWLPAWPGCRRARPASCPR